MPSRQVLATDVLVIGGGSAGCMAAIRMKEIAPTVRVTILEKGTVRQSGCIAMGMDALNNVVVPGVSTVKDYVEAMRLVTEGVYDPAPHRVIAERSFSVAKKLEAWGTPLRHKEDGSYYVHQIHPNAAFTVPMDAPNLKEILFERACAAGVQSIDRTMAISLLSDQHGVCGDIGFHVRTGEILVCWAKAVIIASGGCARFGLPNTGYLFGTVDFPGNTGDGYTLGYRAGADVTGMEYTVNAALVKDLGTPLLVPAQSMGAIMVNCDGEQLEGTVGRAHSSTDVWQHSKGKMMFIRTRHLPEENIRGIEQVLFSTERPVQKRFYEGRGIDLRKDDIELGLTEHYLCGGHGMAGLAVNERAETSVPGLYAAGASAGVAFQYLVGAFVLGEVAAEEAVRYVSQRPAPDFAEGQVRDVEKQIESLVDARPSARVSLEEFEYKVRRTVNEYIVSPKNEWKLQNAIHWMHRFDDEVDNLVAVRDAHDVARYYEMRSIIMSSELSATAALERKESRWGPRHVRIDYPERDDEHWACQIRIGRGDDGLPQVR